MTRKEGSGQRTWTLQTVRDRCTEVGDCLIWAQSVNSAGYPSVSVQGSTRTVRKLVYVDILGKVLSGGRIITSRCHNKLCCSDKCLMQATIGDILTAAHARRRAADPMSLRRDQRASRRAKLSPEIAALILASTDSAKVLGKQYGVHPDAICAIRRGETYRAPAVAVNSIFNLAGSL